MKLNTSRASIANTVIPQIKPVASPAKSAMAPARKIPQSAPVKAGIASEQRRKGQRVLLKVRANIHVALLGKATTLEATTLSVKTDGALVVLKQRLPIETRLVLEHSLTRERIACRVTNASKETPEGFHVPVQFDSPAPGFWKIAFPPADWRPLDEK